MASNYDYIIIGSGFGGSVSALRLAEKGYKVAVVEQGKRYKTEDLPKTNWNFRKYLWFPKLYFFGIQAMTLLKDVFILHGAGLEGGVLCMLIIYSYHQIKSLEIQHGVFKAGKKKYYPTTKLLKKCLVQHPANKSPMPMNY